MALHSPSSVGHGDGDGKSDPNAVFIDTNLNTHLAIISYSSDTVCDLKKKIMLEHSLCFPKVGQIQVHAVKVRRNYNLYHLSDSMLVRSAFSGINGTWFLSVDASAVTEIENPEISNSPGSSNQLASHDIANNAPLGDIGVLLSHPTKRASDFHNFKLPQLENGHGEKEVPFVSPHILEHGGDGVVDTFEKVVELSRTGDAVIASAGLVPVCEGDGFRQGNKDGINLCDEGTLKPLPSAKKKRKRVVERGDTVQDDACKDCNASDLRTGLSTDEQEGNLVPENPSENAGRDELGRNSKNASSVIPMSSDVVKELEVPKEHDGYKDNSKENIDAEYIKSMVEPSEHESTVNKKNKRRKRDLLQDLKDEMQKIEDASQQADVYKSDKEQKKIGGPIEQVETNIDKSGNRIEEPNQKKIEAGSPAKKKKKGKERSRYESALKEKRYVASDSNNESLKPENASQHNLEDQPKIKDSSAGQSAEQCGDAEPQSTGVIGSSKRKKKKSSNNQVAAITTSSKDDADYSRICGEGVQEEMLKDSQISKDNGATKTADDNSEIIANTSREVKVKRTGKSKDHCSLDMRILPSDLDETKELTEGTGLHMHDNMDIDHCPLSEAGQTVLEEEGKKLSPLDYPKQMSEDCMASDQNNTHANVRELTEILEVPKSYEPTECGKSEKKRRKKRNTKDTDRGSLLTEDFIHTDALKNDTVLVESCQATNDEPTPGKTMNGENILNQADGEEACPEEMKGTSDIDKEINDIKVGSKENMSKTEDHVENPSEKRIKKSRKQSPTEKGVSEMLTKDQVLDYKEPSPASHSKQTMEQTSKKKRKSKPIISTKSTNESSGPILEVERESETDPPHSPSNLLKENYKSPPGANETATNSESSFRHEDGNNLKAPTKDEKNSAEQLVASELEQCKDTVSDDIRADKNDANKTDIEPIIGKNRKSCDVMKGNTQSGKLVSTKQLLSKVGDQLGINLREKVPKVRRTGQEASLSSQSNSVTSTIEENRKPQFRKSSGKSKNSDKISEALPLSNSMSKAPKQIIQNKVEKAPGNNINGVVSKNEQKKSLLAGTIFKDDSSGTSEDEDEKAYDSSCSTKSPSDHSLQSDYSDDDSDTGSRGSTGLKSGGGFHIKSRLSGKKGMPLDSILRSSRRYKNAKLMASQLEESESQPLDFVPESQAGT